MKRSPDYPQSTGSLGRTSIEVMPATVGRIACDWDEQRLDLHAASGQIGGSGTGGFTEGVRGSAARFLSAWQRHTTALTIGCEAQADGLRTTIRDYLQTDAIVSEHYFQLIRYLAARR